MERLLSGNQTVWPELTEAIRSARRGNRRAARYGIAYVGNGAIQRLLLRRDDLLVCDASDQAVKLGLTSVQELERMHTKGVRIYSRQGLHAKSGVAGDLVFVGSANATSGSNDRRDEAVMMSHRQELRSEVAAYVLALRDSPSRRVSADEIERMGLLPVRGVSLPGTSATRPVLEAGGRVWLCAWEDDRESQREALQVKSIQEGSPRFHRADQVEAIRLESDKELARWKVGPQLHRLGQFKGQQGVPATSSHR